MSVDVVTKIKCNLTFKFGLQIENKLVVVHGPDLKSETSRVSVSQLLTYKYENIKLFDFHTENTGNT